MILEVALQTSASRDFHLRYYRGLKRQNTRAVLEIIQFFLNAHLILNFVKFLFFFAVFVFFLKTYCFQELL